MDAQAHGHTGAEVDRTRQFDVVETVIQAATHSWRIRHPRSAEALISETEFDKDERLPYWADIWPSARVLADVLVRHRGDSRTALELGCGSGLVACALARAGYRVTATDYYEDALVFTRENVERNVGVSIAARLVDWRSVPDDLGTFDLVVAADVLYERPYAELVADVAARTVAPRGAVIIADPGRIAFEDFLRAVERRGFRVDETWTVPHALEAQRHEVRIVTLLRSPGA